MSEARKFSEVLATVARHATAKLETIFAFQCETVKEPNQGWKVAMCHAYGVACLYSLLEQTDAERRKACSTSSIAVGWKEYPPTQVLYRCNALYGPVNIIATCIYRSLSLSLTLPPPCPNTRASCATPVCGSTTTLAVPAERRGVVAVKDGGARDDNSLAR